MTDLSRRRFVEAAAFLAASAPLAGCASRAASDARAMDAVAMAEAVRSGKTTPAVLVEAAIARLERANAKLNLVSYKAYDAARARAAAAPAGPLAGVPTLVKELSPQKGLPWTEGSRAYKDRVADRTGAYVEAIEAAGLVPLGRSTSPEFGLTMTGESLLNGPTRNPWNPDHSSGGSSSGSGAAVAAGVVPIAHATDGGGSIRIPASVNGLVGLKPSRGRMIGDAARSVTDISVSNCVSRTVRDTAAWYAATERKGADAMFPPVGLVTGPSGVKLRIGARVTNSAGGHPSEDVQAVFSNASLLLQRLGHRVVDQPLFFDGPRGVEAFFTLWGAGAAQAARAATAALGRMPTAQDLEPLTLGMAEVARKAGETGVRDAIATLDEMRKAYVAQFDNIDIHMTPVLGRAPARIGEYAPTIPFEQQRDRIVAYAGYTGSENVAGCPSIALPMGWNRDGLPIGIQFASKPGGERVLLELAYELERELRWFERTPPLWVGA